MIALVATALAVAAAPHTKPSEPMTACEVRTRAWCLLQSGIYFDVTTVDNDKRVWTLRDSMLGRTTIRIVEDRGCSSYPSNVQWRSEAPGHPAPDGSGKYVI